MDPTVAAGLTGAVGVLTGAAAVLAFRLSERSQSGSIETSLGSEMSAGVNDVLAVLRSSTVLLDGRDDIVKASPAAYAFGLVRGEQFVHDELRAMATLVRRDGEIREAELMLRRGPLGAERFDALVRVAPLGSEMVLVLVEDRTEARRIDAVRRDFVANVSHELKTPVGALSLLAEAVLGASDDPEAVRRFAGRMQYEASRLSDLVQELIDLSRLQVADPLQEAHLVDLDEVVVEALDQCRLPAQSKSIDLVSGGEDGVHVLGDQEQLVMALRNLVDNAINYSGEGTRVGVGVRATGELAELTVTDQGIGIPADDLQRIFERFYRVDPARSRATGGTGLGLAIVKHIAANHGGEVVVRSAEGAGSTFTIRLPVAPGGDVADIAPSTAAPATTTPAGPQAQPAVQPAPLPAPREVAP